VPKLGSQHPTYKYLYLVGIAPKDLGGGLLEVQLTYQGNASKKLTTASGVPYSDLKISVDLVQKSFSWSGAAGVSLIGGGSAVVKLDFSAQYTTLEVSFSYTAYAYPNGAIFSAMAPTYAKMITSWTNFSTGPLEGGSYSGYPTIPNPVRPLISVTRFSAAQSSPSTVTNQGEPWDPTPTSTPGTWECVETWGLEYNLGSLGFSNPEYVATTPAT
jgi:hypothetical protein